MAPSSLQKSFSPSSHVGTIIFMNIVSSRIPLMLLLSLFVMQQASWRERFECIPHQVRDCSSTLCPLDVDVTLIHFCVVCIVWNNLQIILGSSSVKEPVARFSYECFRVKCICVIAKTTLATLSSAQQYGKWRGMLLFPQITDAWSVLTRWLLSRYDSVDSIFMINYISFEKQ